MTFATLLGQVWEEGTTVRMRCDVQLGRQAGTEHMPSGTVGLDSSIHIRMVVYAVFANLGEVLPYNMRRKSSSEMHLKGMQTEPWLLIQVFSWTLQSSGEVLMQQKSKS